MMKKSETKNTLWCSVAVFFILAGSGVAAENAPITPEQFLLLQRQNDQLQQQLRKQQEMIDSLTRKVSEIQDAAIKQNRELTGVKGETGTPSADKTFRLGKADLSGEGGVAFFRSEPQGQNPKPTFRIDEARLFVEAPLWQDVYFFTELDLATREDTALNLSVGELYLDFENVSQLWNRDGMLNLRAGRFYTPFGEEYLNRFAIDNPLISHSVSDIWGTDDGVELYGKLGRVQYVLAAQNGGAPTSRALQSDKAVIGRVGYDPAKWLHLSVSGMRTGNLSVNNHVSSLWFANGFFRSLGGPGTTTFHANLVEADAQIRLSCVQLKAAGGYVDYGDNDPNANNHRNVYYYYVEGVHDFTPKFYTAARFSQVLAPHGFPLVGNGTMGAYLFSSDLTRDYWRLSLGLGYRFNSNLLLKGEYSFNQGSEPDGDKRTGENLFALEAAFKF